MELNMSAFAQTFNDPAGDWRDNQADGFKAEEPGDDPVSPDSQADGYKEPGTEARQPVFAGGRAKWGVQA
jgi:hypothetical protein